MTSVLAAHQPNFAPYLPWWQKMLVADVFVIADDLQFSTGGWMNRCEVLDRSGVTKLTVPLKSWTGFEPINQIEIAHTQKGYDRDILDKLAGIGAKKYLIDFLRPAIQGHTKLIDLNMEVIRVILDWMDRPNTYGTFFYSSKMLSSKGLNPTDRIIQWCTELRCRRYLSGVGGRNYLDPEKMTRAGIEVIWQDMLAPMNFKYRQKLSDEFKPNLSILDCMINSVDLPSVAADLENMRSGRLE